MPNNLQEIFDAFSHSTRKSMLAMCKEEIPTLAPFAKGSRPQESFAVAALIGLTSNSVRGSVGIYFPKKVFCGLISSMMGEPVKSIEKENEDAATELLNIIYGDAKVFLNERGYGIQMALPSLLRGGNVVSPGSKLLEIIVIPFTTQWGEFYVEFSLAPSKNPKVAGGAPSGPIVPMTNSEKAGFFKPFIESTIKTFKTQFTLDVTTGTPSSKKGSDAFSFDIAGIIGVTSHRLTGSYMVSFKKDVYLKLLSKMLGETFTEIQPGFEDAVAELLNIILGGAKVVLNDQLGHSIEMALPSLVYGESVRSAQQPGKTALLIPFYSDIGRFMVEVAID